MQTNLLSEAIKQNNSEKYDFSQRSSAISIKREAIDLNAASSSTFVGKERPTAEAPEK